LPVPVAFGPPQQPPRREREEEMDAGDSGSSESGSENEIEHEIGYDEQEDEEEDGRTVRDRAGLRKLKSTPAGESLSRLHRRGSRRADHSPECERIGLRNEYRYPSLMHALSSPHLPSATWSPLPSSSPLNLTQSTLKYSMPHHLLRSQHLDFPRPPLSPHRRPDSPMPVTLTLRDRASAPPGSGHGNANGNGTTRQRTNSVSTASSVGGEDWDLGATRTTYHVAAPHTHQVRQATNRKAKASRLA